MHIGKDQNRNSDIQEKVQLYELNIYQRAQNDLTRTSYTKIHKQLYSYKTIKWRDSGWL